MVIYQIVRVERVPKGRTTSLRQVFLNKERAELHADKLNEESTEVTTYFVNQLEVVDYQDTAKELLQGFKTKSGTWAITGYVDDMNEANILGMRFVADDELKGAENNRPLKSYSTERTRRSPVPDKPEPRP